MVTLFIVPLIIPLPEIFTAPIVMLLEELIDIFPIFAFPDTLKFPRTIFPVVSPVMIPVPSVMFPVVCMEIFPMLAV